MHAAGTPKALSYYVSAMYCISYVLLLLWGLKVHGFQKTPKSLCVYCKDQHCIDPNYHRLSILRNAHPFPVPQSKLEAALFGATFSFKPDCSRYGYFTKG
jgi:hypothetical protein